jgi:hypothetical protein
MDSKRGKTSKRSASASSAERRRLWMAAGLLGAVLALLLTGAVLEIDPAEHPPALGSAGVGGTGAAGREGAPIRSAAEGAHPGSPDGPTLLARLGRRALDDARRLGADPGQFTLQLAVACQADTVDALVERVRDESDLYVLPMTLDGRSCFRVCWGSFDTSERARRQVLPPGLATVVERPLVREIAEVLE